MKRIGLKIVNAEIKKRIHQHIQEMSEYCMGPDLEKLKD